MGRADLEHFVHGNIELIIRLVAERRRPAQDELFNAVELGTNRALQGVPPDSLVQSFRCAERLMVDTLLIASELPREALREEILHLETVIDDVCFASLAAYRRAQDDITVNYDRLERDLVSRLSARDWVDPEVTGEARRVGMDPSRPHVAMAAIYPREVVDQMSALHIRRRLLGCMGDIVAGRILSGTTGPHLLFIIPYTGALDHLRATLLETLQQGEQMSHVAVGLGELSATLATVGRSCRQAVVAADVGRATRRHREVLAYDDVIEEALFLGDRDAASRLVSARLGPLASDRRLIETLGVYLRNDRSQKATAAALGVHVNTVGYRLRQIEERLGCDLNSMVDLYRLRSALLAESVLGDPATEPMPEASSS